MRLTKVVTAYSSGIENTFNNPIINGGDPFVFQKDGFNTIYILWQLQSVFGNPKI